MFVVHRIVRGASSGSWRWNRGFWIVGTMFALLVAFTLPWLNDALGVNLAHELVGALERGSSVSVAVSGAALAAGLVGLTLMAPPRLEMSAGRENEDSGVVFTASCLAVTTFAATAAFVSQWWLLAFAPLSPTVRSIPGALLATFLVIMLDGLLATPFWIARLVRSRSA